MVDLVGTCPKGFWEEWIAEGDAAGDAETGEEWGWYSNHSLIRCIGPGDRFYVVAHGLLRGYAPVTRVTAGAICRRGDAVAVTIIEPIPGFRGLRERWWLRDRERPFPEWKTKGVNQNPARKGRRDGRGMNPPAERNLDPVFTAFIGGMSVERTQESGE